jgi:hypothetical protein
MVTRSDNWLFEPHFEYEYKSYQIRGFAQRIKSRFESWQLYPYMDELKTQIDLISRFVESRRFLEDQFRGSVESIDLKEFKIERDKFPEDLNTIPTIEEILKLAEGEFSRCELEGRIQLELAKDQIHIEPFGLLAPQLSGGLLLFQLQSTARIYTYEFRIVRRPHQICSYKDLRTMLIEEVSLGKYTNWNQVRWSLLKKRKDIPVANSYYIQTATELPHFETVLPIVKNFLIEQSDQLS